MSEKTSDEHEACDDRRCVFCGGTPKESSCDSKRPTPLQESITNYIESLSDETEQ